MKEDFNIEGMSCSACVQAVEKSVAKLDGVNSVAVNLLTNSMKVDFTENEITADAIVESVQNAGYDATIKRANTASSAQTKDSGNPLENQLKKDEQSLKHRIIISLIFMIPLMYIAMGPMIGLPTLSIFEGMDNIVIFAFTQMLITLPILYTNRKYYQNGFKALFKGNPNMDSLVAIGSSAAFIYGIYVIYKLSYAMGHNQPDMLEHFAHALYFESSAMILTLITLGKYFEARSKGKTTNAIKKLMDLSPKTATLLIDGKEKEIPLEEVKVGDVLLVKPGSAVPVDGRILSGQGAFDESAITGESMPVEKGKDEKVIGATLLKLGSITMVSEKVGDDTAIAKIIQLVQDANTTKAPITKLADKISGIFVPTVIGISIVTMIIWLLLGYSFEFAFQLGVSVLIISCPCALGLATPVAIMVGTGKGASQGILIKSAEALETLHEVDAIVFDKTGTITEGKPQVTDLLPVGNVTEAELLKIAASLESVSEHPLSLAIMELANEQKVKYPAIQNFYNQLGKGISGEIDDQTYYAGNSKYMNELGIDISQILEKSDQLSEDGKTILYFSSKDNLLGIIAVADQIKENSKEAIEVLHEQGLEVYLLTGDNERTAQAIGKNLKFDQILAEVLPEDKDQKVIEIQNQNKKVAMVGDGINDAPSLARADVGIAIGAGTDIAIEAADIVLMKSDLSDVVNSIALSKKTITNIKQNLFWAFFYNIICIPLAAGVFYLPFNILLNPMIAAAAMSMSSIFVVSNALRLNNFKPVMKGLEETSSIEQNIIQESIVDQDSEDNSEENTKEISNENSSENSSENNENSNENMEGKETMKKTIYVEGMTCKHCKARVEKTLKDFEQVDDAVVDLDNKLVEVTFNADVDNQVLTDAIVDAGYEVTSIEG